MDIKVLGTGCRKCGELERAVYKASKEIGLNVSVEKVEEMDKITSYGVLLTPGLVVNGKVKSSGRVPKHRDVIGFIREEM